jgi:hypothetical protein
LIYLYLLYNYINKNLRGKRGEEEMIIRAAKEVVNDVNVNYSHLAKLEVGASCFNIHSYKYDNL